MVGYSLPNPVLDDVDEEEEEKENIADQLQVSLIAFSVQMLSILSIILNKSIGYMQLYTHFKIEETKL